MYLKYKSVFLALLVHYEFLVSRMSVTAHTIQYPYFIQSIFIYFRYQFVVLWNKVDFQEHNPLTSCSSDLNRLCSSDLNDCVQVI